MLYSISNKIQKSWRFIAIITLGAVILSLVLSYTAVPLYRAKATFHVYPNANLSSSRDVMTSLDTLDKRTITNTYALILSSYQVFLNTVDAVGLTPEETDGYVISAEVQEDANVINLFIEGPDPIKAAQLANNIGQNGIAYIKGIYQVYEITFLDTARENISLAPFYPQPLQSMLLYGGTGLLIGIVLVLLSGFIQAPIDAIRLQMMKDGESDSFTRQHFVRMAEKSLSKDPGTQLSLAILELRGLEGLIGRLPDVVQTEILTGVTTRLRNQLKGNDLVGRWEENTFSILLPYTPGEPAARIMERIRLQLEEHITISATGETMELLPLMGVASNEPEDDINSLSTKAETAAKAARSNHEKTVLYSKGLNGELE